ncbi:hypothetical protein Tco_0528942 [Tanacetum coccineum]
MFKNLARWPRAGAWAARQTQIGFQQFGSWYPLDQALIIGSVGFDKLQGRILELYVKSNYGFLGMDSEGGIRFETKLKETPYELLEDDQKKKIGKNNEANMTLYNALPRKEYERVFMCKTAKEFLHALPLKWRAMVTAIEEAKDLATLPLDELI